MFLDIDTSEEYEKLKTRRTGEPKMTGTVKKIIRDKGYGFIVPDDGSEDVFFHRSSTAPRVSFEDIAEGNSVQFQVRRGEKGPVAFDLKIR